MTTAVLFSCRQERKSTSVSTAVAIETIASSAPIINQIEQTDSIAPFIDTTYEYTDAQGNRIIVQNSLPKGGLTYTSSNGQDYVYAIFWTQIINETDHPFALSLEMPESSFPHGTSFDNSLKVLLPKTKMSIDKVSLFDYGLTDIDANLENTLQKSTSLKITVDPKESRMFYVVTLFRKGLDGIVRAGLKLKEEAVVYKVNDTEFQSGHINLKNLKPQQ